MQLITGYQIDDHITSVQDAMFHRGIWNKDCIIECDENLDAQIVSNNEIRIRSGIMSFQGRFCCIEPNTYDVLNLNNGNIGENRIDLIVLQYEKNSDTQVESVTLKVIQGTPSVDTPVIPAYITGDIDLGDSPVELPIFQVNISGINITNIDTLLPIIAPYSKLTDSPKLIFSGAVRDINSSLTLIESFKDFRSLIFGISIDSTGTIYYLNECSTLGEGSIRPNLVAPIGTASSYSSVRSYIGLIHRDSETQLSIAYPFKYLTHLSDTNHSEISDPMYVREIWGVR